MKQKIKAKGHYTYEYISKVKGQGRQYPHSFFKKKGINKYTWIRVANGRVIERVLMDYVLITKRMVGRLKDVHVFRVWLHVCLIIFFFFFVEAKVVVTKEWGNRVVGCRREVVQVEELKKPEKIQEYQDKLKETYDRVKEREAKRHMIG